MALRGRDIQGIIKEHGLELGTVRCLIQLADEQSAQRAQIKEMTAMIQRIIDFSTDQNTALVALSGEYKKMAERYDPNSEANNEADHA